MSNLAFRNKPGEIRIFEIRVPFFFPKLLHLLIATSLPHPQISPYFALSGAFPLCNSCYSPQFSPKSVKTPFTILKKEMKFLEYTPFERINDFLDHLNLGECTIKGCLEAYSCKHTGTDKKLSLSLNHEILDYLGQSSGSDSSSPADFLLSRSSRKTLIYLVLSLYHMYPDYDFSAVKAHQFFTEECWDSFKQILDNYLFEASRAWHEVHGDGSLLETLQHALDEVVKLSECEIYSYNPTSDADPFSERGSIWSFSFFFYNRKLKRVVPFRFCCLSNLAGEGFVRSPLGFEGDGDIFDDMDM